MRVALISYHSFFQPGGVKRHILGLQKEFKRRGIYCKIIAPRRKKTEDYGKDVILLGTSFPLPFSGASSDFSINFNPFLIEEILKKEQFDVLHFHNFGFPSSWQILERSKALNILTFHANIKGSKLLKNFPIITDLLKRVAKWKIDGIIGVAPLNIKVFKDYHSPKIVIPNGVDIDEFNPKALKIRKFIDDRINLLFVGRFEKRKGLIYLLKAYRTLERKFSNLRLIIVGEGELKNECEQYIKDSNLKEVYFVGKKIEKELVSYYNTCDIFVSPAIFGESFGLVLLEAMACKKPVVAFANQGYKEFLQDKKGSFLAKNRDYKDLAKKIEILVKNEGLRKKMAELALAEAREYSWQNIADRVLNFYEICQRKKTTKEKPSFSLEKSVEKILKNFEKMLEPQ